MARSGRFASVVLASAVLALAGRAEAGLILKGKDAPVQVELPDGWAKAVVPKGASDVIQVMGSNGQTGGGVMLAEEKGKPSEKTLADYGDTVIDGMAGKMSHATHTDWVKIKVDGCDALRCELSGGGKKPGDLELTDIVTVLKTDESYDQIVVWAETADFAKNKAELTKIADSFHRGKATDKSTFKGRSKNVSVEVPAGWAQEELTDDNLDAIELTATDEKDNQGIMVLWEPLIPKMTLDQYGKKVIDSMSGRLTGAKRTDFQKIKVDGRDALRCELTGTRSGLALGYLVTVTKSDTSFDQILAWSEKETFTKSKADLAKVSDSFKQGVEPPAGTPRTIPGKNGTVSLDVPGTWSSKKTNAGSVMQLMAANGTREAFASVITESREDLKYDLQEYADKAVDNMIKRGSDGSHTDWVKTKIDGHDALQCELRMTTQNLKIAYVVTIVQTPDNYHQVLAWSEASAFDKFKPELSKIANGLKEKNAGQ